MFRHNTRKPLKAVTTAQHRHVMPATEQHPESKLAPGMCLGSVADSVCMEGVLSGHKSFHVSFSL